MKKHSINFLNLKPIGKATIKAVDETIEIRTMQSITSGGFHLGGTSYQKNSVILPQKYQLPLRIDMRIKLDYPAFVLRIGEGHVYFASGHDTEYFRIKDIVEPESKPSKENFYFDNRLTFDEFTEISIIYNFNEMQILIKEEERFYSQNQPYMKKKHSDAFVVLNQEGFELGLSVTKHAILTVAKMTVTEYEEDVQITRGSFELPDPLAPKPEKMKANYESVAGKIPLEFQSEIREMDIFFKSLRPMRFKRTVDKSGCKITYVASDVGISYTIVASGAESYHHFGWYFVYNGPVETWHRKADYMEEILSEIAKSDRRLSERVFNALVDCCGCYQGGLCKTLYKFDDNKLLSCHGRTRFRMNFDDFKDVREFFRYLNDFIELKIAIGDPAPEKIFLAKQGG